MKSFASSFLKHAVMIRFALLPMVLLAVFAPFADAQPRLLRRNVLTGGGSCADGSCGSSSTTTMMQSSSSWGSAAPSAPVERTPTIAFEMQSIDTFVNLERTRRGLKPVVVTQELSDAAAYAISPAAISGKDAHKLPMKESHAVAVAHKTPFAAFQAWMGDPGIASMIVASNYTTCGIASVRGSDGSIYRVLVMGGEKQGVVERLSAPGE